MAAHSPTFIDDSPGNDNEANSSRSLSICKICIQIQRQTDSIVTPAVNVSVTALAFSLPPHRVLGNELSPCQLPIPSGCPAYSSLVSQSRLLASRVKTDAKMR